MVPNSIKIPVSFEYVFPNGALFLGVDKLVDFDQVRDDDNQARDENGIRMWVVKVMDLDPNAGNFGRSTEVKVKIAAKTAPVPPASVVPGYPPAVAFTDLTVTPYTDSNACKGDRQPHKCRARLAWSIRAGAMVAPDRSHGCRNGLTSPVGTGVIRQDTVRPNGFEPHPQSSSQPTKGAFVSTLQDSPQPKTAIQLRAGHFTPVDVLDIASAGDVFATAIADVAHHQISEPGYWDCYGSHPMNWPVCATHSTGCSRRSTTPARSCQPSNGAPVAGLPGKAAGNGRPPRARGRKSLSALASGAGQCLGRTLPCPGPTNSFDPSKGRVCRVDCRSTCGPGRHR